MADKRIVENAIKLYAKCSLTSRARKITGVEIKGSEISLRRSRVNGLATREHKLEEIFRIEAYLCHQISHTIAVLSPGKYPKKEEDILKTRGYVTMMANNKKKENIAILSQFDRTFVKPLSGPVALS